MTHELIVGGVILSPLVAELLLAVLIAGLLTFILMRIGFYRLVWHRPLVELAIFCMVLGAVVALTPGDWPIWLGPALPGASQ